MEKSKINVSTYQNKETFCKRKMQNIIFDSLNSEIRLGISIADEKAKKEYAKRKIEAPLTTEEKIFQRK